MLSNVWFHLNVALSSRLQKAPYISVYCENVYLLVKVGYAIILIRCIYSKWYPIKVISTNYARKTLGMIRFASGAKYAFHYGLHTYWTLLQSLQVIIFTKRFSIQRIKWFALQIHRTLRTREARDVENVLHSCTTRVLSYYESIALKTRSWKCCTNKLLEEKSSIINL